MSDGNATPPSWSGSGIIQSFFTLPASSELSQETLEEWLDEVYLNALIDTGAVTSAWRFKAANPEYGKQNLLIYKVPDLAQAGKIRSVPRTSEKFPSGEPVDTFVESESRILSLVQLCETTKHPEGLPALDES